MKHLRLSALSLLLVLSMGACGKAEDPAATEPAQLAKSILSLVPADTPYILANLQPIPEDVIDANFKRMEPLTTEMQAQLSGLKSGLASGGPSVTGDEFSDRLLLALLDEFDGKLNREGLESLGWDLQSANVIYGVGAFPVARMGLSDAATLRATILRVLENAEVNATEHEYKGLSYWRIASPNTDEVPVALYVSILSDHLAAGMFPLTAETQYLPSFLGLEKPVKNDAAQFLAGLNTKHGFTPFGTAFLDLHRLADEFLDPGATTARAMMSFENYDMSDFSEQCVSETHAMIDKVPTMVFGITEMKVEAIAYSFLAEMPATLATQLGGLVPAIPAARAVSERIAELSFGLKVGAARDFLRQQAQAIVDQPFQCEHYKDLNEQAAQGLVKLDQPMPPFVNNFRGIRLSLEDIVITPDQQIPTDVKGHLAVHVDQPEMFVGMAQMFLPDLANLSLAPGGPPVRIPESLVSVQGIVAYAAMSDDAIGMSVGEGEEGGLPDFLDQDAGPEGVFFSVDYDNEAYYDYQLKGLEASRASMEGDTSIMDLSEAAIRATQAAGDRNHMTMKFTSEGLLIENRMTYK